ncbi:hypothetical protein [Clostridium fallax]|nr:hypothetical protein [Clostridium fallax]
MDKKGLKNRSTIVALISLNNSYKISLINCIEDITKEYSNKIVYLN